jgi:hypothetical protein
MMGAQHMLDLDSKCAFSMGQMSNDAAMKDAQIKSSKEAFALSMGQRTRRTYVAKKYAII